MLLIVNHSCKLCIIYYYKIRIICVFYLIQVSTAFQAAKIKVAEKMQKLKYLSDDLFLVESFVRIFKESIIVKWVGHIHCSQVPITKLKADLSPCYYDLLLKCMTPNNV